MEPKFCVSSQLRAEGEQKKQPYKPPVLTDIGPVEKLSLSGTVSGTEGMGHPERRP